jgi:hypothetical protein
LFIFITCVSFTAWAVGPRGQSVMHARSPATKMMNFRLGLYVVLPKSSAGAINFIWTTYLGNYHNCSTLVFLQKCRDVLDAIKGVFMY